MLDIRCLKEGTDRRWKSLRYCWSSQIRVISNHSMFTIRNFTVECRHIDGLMYEALLLTSYIITWNKDNYNQAETALYWNTLVPQRLHRWIDSDSHNNTTVSTGAHKTFIVNSQVGWVWENIVVLVKDAICKHWPPVTCAASSLKWTRGVLVFALVAQELHMDGRWPAGHFWHVYIRTFIHLLLRICSVFHVSPLT